MIPIVRKLKNDIIYVALRMVIAIVRALPRRIALKLAGIAGEMAAILDVRERKLAENNLRRAYGETWSDARIRLVARECFVKLAKNTADVIHSQNWSMEHFDSLVNVEGMEHFDDALAQGRGLVAITGHLGNFEFAAAWLAAVKKVDISVIGRKLYDDRLDALVVQNRKGFGMGYIPSDAPAKTVYSVLKKSRVLGVLMDLDSSKVAGHFVPFFGTLAKTAAGPMVIGRKTGSPVVPLAMFRTTDDRYSLKILPSFDIPNTDDKETDVKWALTRCNASLEQLINHDPTQWAWIHDRWKSKPEEDR